MKILPRKPKAAEARPAARPAQVNAKASRTVAKKFGDEMSNGRMSALRNQAAKFLPSVGGAALKRADAADGVGAAAQLTGRFDELIGLRKGNSGERVGALQDRLLEVAPMTDAERTQMRDGRGTFGNLTETVVKRFQTQQGLPATGVIDEATAARLEAPLPPSEIAAARAVATEARVREHAEAQVMNAVGDRYRHLPPEDQAAIRAEAAAAGDAAVARYREDLEGLVDQELADMGVTRETADADTLATAQLGALGRVNASYDALELSAAQMDPATGTLVNSNNGLSVSTDNTAWNDWCLAFTSSVYGRKATDLHSGSAIEAANAASANGTLQTDRDYAEWPPGTVVFFAATTDNGNAGHVAVFTGRYTADGDPIIRTSGWSSNPGITEMPLSELEGVTGDYIGNIPYPDVN